MVMRNIRENVIPHVHTTPLVVCRSVVDKVVVCIVSTERSMGWNKLFIYGHGSLTKKFTQNVCRDYEIILNYVE
jgi:hypothetical protein